MLKQQKKELTFPLWIRTIVISIIVFEGAGNHMLMQPVYGVDTYTYWSDATGSTHLADIEVTSPAPSYSKYWLAGSAHTVTCTTITDKDHKCKNGTEYMGTVDDTVTHYWTGASGKFEQDNNIGTSVSYVCSYSEGVDSITCNADDNYAAVTNYYRGQSGGDEGPEGSGGDDSGTSDTHYVYVRIPGIEQFTWGTTKHAINDVSAPEYDNSASKNEPACYTKNNVVSASDVYFYNANDLTQASGVNVIACSRTLTSQEIDSSQTPDANIVWLSGGGTWKTWSSYKLSSMAGSGQKLVNYIHKYNANVPFYWYYKVSSVDPADARWISCGSTSHTIYTVYSTPSCDSALVTKANLDTCVGWAEGCTKVDTSNDSNNVPRKVQLGAKNWHTTYGYQGTAELPDNPFAWIPSNKGDCKTYAHLMTKGLNLLGVTASTEEIQCKIGGTRHFFFTQGQTPNWLTAAR